MIPRPLSPLGLPRLEAPCWPEPCLRLEVSALQTRWEPGLLEPASNPILPPRPLRKWHGPITTTMKGPCWSKSTATRNMRWVSRSSHPGPGFYDAELTNIFGRIPGTHPGFPSQSRLTRSTFDGPWEPQRLSLECQMTVGSLKTCWRLKYLYIGFEKA